MEKDPLDSKPMMHEIEEDPEMYAMAGIELVTVPSPVPVQGRIESIIRQAWILCLL